ncbi:hypothetical protein BDN72DRAFT_955384 [Pluteus cervinus]|uniref:Uncharacterized protein n=1 Tax=Pluteus cervinus TaxID=181527 RepID=A0ACD3BBG7_9AGAR|nr:hypothetical protein BDN72DRAFT_955384 [Pluteus cervinus]
MWTSRLLALSLAAAPALVSAGIFPSDSLVKMVDAKDWKNIMDANQTSLVAFIAPWCGHCQRMAPELSKAALGLHPLIPTYAVNCDKDRNKKLCSEQGVKGFPTVKLFPRGKRLQPAEFDGADRTASAFWYFATRRIPNLVNKLYSVDQIEPWARKHKDSGKTRLLLLTKEKKVPLLWLTLANKYTGKEDTGHEVIFASHRDIRGKSSVELGYEAGEKKDSKILVYPPGSDKAIRYQGINKFDSLSKFLDSILDGTADLVVANEEAAKEEFVPDEKELELEVKQEAQRIALLHGGFTSLIDFEKAIAEGGANYHDTHGYGGMMGGSLKDFAKKDDKAAKAESKSAESETPQSSKAAEPAESQPAADAVPIPESESQQVLAEETKPESTPSHDTGSETGTTSEKEHDEL